MLEKINKKRQGMSLLIITIATAMLIGALSLSIVQIHSSSFNVLDKNNKIFQAQIYALDQANLIRITDYDSIASEQRMAVRNSGLYREVKVENKISADNKFNIKTAVVSVYDTMNSSAVPLATFTMDVYKKI